LVVGATVVPSVAIVVVPNTCTDVVVVGIVVVVVVGGIVVVVVVGGAVVVVVAFVVVVVGAVVVVVGCGHGLTSSTDADRFAVTLLGHDACTVKVAVPVVGPGIVVVPDVIPLAPTVVL
jgi:hypothetical protein